jgi:hypothetical protein
LRFCALDSINGRPIKCRSTRSLLCSLPAICCLSLFVFGSFLKGVGGGGLFFLEKEKHQLETDIVVGPPNHKVPTIGPILPIRQFHGKHDRPLLSSRLGSPKETPKAPPGDALLVFGLLRRLGRRRFGACALGSVPLCSLLSDFVQTSLDLLGTEVSNFLHHRPLHHLGSNHFSQTLC